MGIDYNNLTSPNDTNNCITNHSDESYILREQVQAQAANWNMYKSLVNFLPTTLAPIIYGSLGDKLGRRLLLIIPSIGSILYVSIYMAIIKFNLPVWVILFSCVSSLFGGFGVLFTGAFAYLSDTVPPERRALRMTIVDVVALSNGAIANLFVGYWIRAQGFLWPLVFVLCGKIICLLYAIFLVPETLTKNGSNTASRKLKWRDCVAAIKISFYDNGSGRRWKINTLLFSYAVSGLISSYEVTALYLMNVPLCWSSVKLGYYNFINALVLAIGMLIVSAVPARYITGEWKIVVSRISSVLGSVYTAIAVTSLMMYFGEHAHYIGVIWCNGVSSSFLGLDY